MRHIRIRDGIGRSVKKRYINDFSKAPTESPTWNEPVDIPPMMGSFMTVHV
jgi:hypothetical protein